MSIAYSHKANALADRIAMGAFCYQAVRDRLLRDTRHQSAYEGARSLHEEQAGLRRAGMKQPFYVNYFCGRDAACDCRAGADKSLETDLMLFLEGKGGRRLALSIEIKTEGDRLRTGQGAAYPLRAACWQSGRTGYDAIVPHDDWLTVLFCPKADLDHPEARHFDSRIPLEEAAQWVPAWPR